MNIMIYITFHNKNYELSNYFKHHDRAGSRGNPQTICSHDLQIHKGRSN